MKLEERQELRKINQTAGLLALHLNWLLECGQAVKTEALILET